MMTMRRTRRREVLYSAYLCRILMIKAVTAAVSGKGNVAELTVAANSIRSAAAAMPESVVRPAYLQLARLVDIAMFLVGWREAVRTAEQDADRHLRAAKVGVREFVREYNNPASFERFAAEVTATSDIDQVSHVCESLL